MTRQEYNSIQWDLMHHHDKALKMSMTTRDRDAYQKAMLACKSILSNYNPDKLRGKQVRIGG